MYEGRCGHVKCFWKNLLLECARLCFCLLLLLAVAIPGQYGIVCVRVDVCGNVAMLTSGQQHSQSVVCVCK